MLGGSGLFLFGIHLGDRDDAFQFLKVLKPW
jgi:hypothetical protein